MSSSRNDQTVGGSECCANIYRLRNCAGAAVAMLVQEHDVEHRVQACSTGLLGRTCTSCGTTMYASMSKCRFSAFLRSHGVIPVARPCQSHEVVLCVRPADVMQCEMSVRAKRQRGSSTGCWNSRWRRSAPRTALRRYRRSQSTAASSLLTLTPSTTRSSCSC